VEKCELGRVSCKTVKAIFHKNWKPVSYEYYDITEKTLHGESLTPSMSTILNLVKVPKVSRIGAWLAGKILGNKNFYLKEFLKIDDIGGKLSNRKGIQSKLLLCY